MALALFGITNERPEPGRQPLILFLVVLWLALVAWTFFDARRRIGDPVLVACATGASLFPFVGTIVYSILRPPEFLADARARAGDPRLGAARAPARGAVVSELRAPGRAHLPALPELPRPDQGPVRVVRKADRPALVGLPLLRDAAAPRAASRRRRARGAAPTPTPSARPKARRAPKRRRRPAGRRQPRAAGRAPRAARPARGRPSAGRGDAAGSAPATKPRTARARRSRRAGDP